MIALHEFAVLDEQGKRAEVNKAADEMVRTMTTAAERLAFVVELSKCTTLDEMFLFTSIFAKVWCERITRLDQIPTCAAPAPALTHMAAAYCPVAEG